MTPRATTIKRVIDEIFELTYSQEFNGSPSRIGLKFGLSGELSAFIPSAPVKYSILLREGARRSVQYRWRREMCRPNQTLAARIDKDYSEKWSKANNSRKLIDGLPRIILESKVCSKCKNEKPIADFGKSNKETSGRRCQCKECDKMETRERRLKGIDEMQPIIGLSVSTAPDDVLVAELRKRGFEVVAQKLIQL